MVQKYSSSLDFLVNTLQTSIDTKHTFSKVEPLLEANLDFLNEDFITVFRDWAKAALCSRDSHYALNLTREIVHFSFIIRSFSQGNKAINFEIALAGYEVSFEALTFEENPQQWGFLQSQLGEMYEQRYFGSKSENIEKSIQCFQNALKFFTYENFPEQWLKLNFQLGFVYNDPNHKDYAENLEKVIKLYKTVISYRVLMEERSQNQLLEESSMAQVNLGNAYYQRVFGLKVENLENAIRCYNLALKFYSYKSSPRSWARIHNLLGIAYSDNFGGNRDANMENAIRCYQSALRVYTPSSFPEQWAMVQMNLGDAYRERLSGDRTDNIENAIDCLQNALMVFSHEAFPADWAMAHHNLGIAYRQRVFGHKSENLEHALRCYQSALQVYTRDSYPHSWVASQAALGTAYYHRIRGSRVENIGNAIHCFQSILTSQITGISDEKIKMYLQMIATCRYTLLMHNLLNASSGDLEAILSQNQELVDINLLRLLEQLRGSNSDSSIVERTENVIEMIKARSA